MYTIPQLRTAMAWAKAHPNDTIRIHWAPFGQQHFTGTAWRAWFQQCLMTKINRTLPQPGWRKLDSGWYWEMWRASRDLNTPRLAIHWLPTELRARFAARLAD